jgi:alkylmercury lyase
LTPSLEPAASTAMSRGRVLGSAGLTLAHGPHGLEIGGHAFRTWCAFDALGIPAALVADARVETACCVCGRSIVVELRDGRPAVAGPALLWLAAGGADLRADFCTPTVLLCSEAHAHVWAERRAGRGRALGLIAAVEEGARNWASAAATARRLSQAGPVLSQSEVPGPEPGG